MFQAAFPRPAPCRGASLPAVIRDYKNDGGPAALQPPSGLAFHSHHTPGLTAREAVIYGTQCRAPGPACPVCNEVAGRRGSRLAGLC